MYTTRKSEIAKLRAYRDELDDLYADALRRHDLPRARSVHGLRQRVNRAVLLYEEWHAGEAPTETRQASVLEEADALLQQIFGR